MMNLVFDIVKIHPEYYLRLYLNTVNILLPTPTIYLDVPHSKDVKCTSPIIEIHLTFFNFYI